MARGVDPVAFVAEHGVVLASARGPVPNVAEAIAGAPIRGSWWAHPRGNDIFAALTAISEHADIKSFKLVDGKVTFVHRRLWPALVRLADELGRERLAEVRQEHTAAGAHRNVVTPFPRWVPPRVLEDASTLGADDARAALGEWVAARGRSVRGQRGPGRGRRRRYGTSCSPRRRSCSASGRCPGTR